MHPRQGRKGTGCTCPRSHARPSLQPPLCSASASHLALAPSPPGPPLQLLDPADSYIPLDQFLVVTTATGLVQVRTRGLRCEGWPAAEMCGDLLGVVVLGWDWQHFGNT